jgi:hypothetical protein
MGIALSDEEISVQKMNITLGLPWKCCFCGETWEKDSYCEEAMIQHSIDVKGCTDWRDAIPKSLFNGTLGIGSIVREIMDSPNNSYSYKFQRIVLAAWSGWTIWSAEELLDPEFWRGPDGELPPWNEAWASWIASIPGATISELKAIYPDYASTNNHATLTLMSNRMGRDLMIKIGGQGVDEWASRFSLTMSYRDIVSPGILGRLAAQVSKLAKNEDDKTVASFVSLYALPIVMGNGGWTRQEFVALYRAYPSIFKGTWKRLAFNEALRRRYMTPFFPDREYGSVKEPFLESDRTIWNYLLDERGMRIALRYSAQGYVTKTLMEYVIPFSGQNNERQRLWACNFLKSRKSNRDLRALFLFMHEKGALKNELIKTFKWVKPEPCATSLKLLMSMPKWPPSNLRDGNIPSEAEYKKAIMDSHELIPPGSEKISELWKIFNKDEAEGVFAAMARWCDKKDKIHGLEGVTTFRFFSIYHKPYNGEYRLPGQED